MLAMGNYVGEEEEGNIRDKVERVKRKESPLFFLFIVLPWYWVLSLPIPLFQGMCTCPILLFTVDALVFCLPSRNAVIYESGIIIMQSFVVREYRGIK